MDPLVGSLGIPIGVAGWDLIQNKTPADFPALTKDPIVQREITYFEQNAPKATTAQALLNDPRLQDFALTAFGLTSENGLTALMTKVLNSDTTKSNSFAAQMLNQAYVQIAASFNYGGTVTPAKPAKPSSAQVQTSGLGAGSTFQNFGGTFAGVSVKYVDLTQATSPQQVANVLQVAFRRADGNKTNISVTVNGNNLQFTDKLGRGTASGFTFSSNVADTGAQPTASAPTNLVAGSKAVPASGGPAVTSPAFIKQMVQKYTEAQFQVVVGNSSNALREALYAKQQLPNVTSWYQVIADKPLANIVHTLLGLPVYFGALDVTQQKQVLTQRMNIADFKNPAKLSKLLTQFVAMSSNQSQQSSSAIAASMLDNIGSKNMINLTLPNPNGGATNSFSNSSAAAMIMSTAFPNG